MPFELTYADDNNQFLYYNNAHQDPDCYVCQAVVYLNLVAVWSAVPRLHFHQLV